MVLTFKVSCSSLSLYPLLNRPFSSPWKQNTHGWGTSDGWMHLSEAIPQVIQLIWSQVPFGQARLEGNYSQGQCPWPLTLPLLQMDTEAALAKAFGEVDILLTWMQKFYQLWLSARMMSSFVFHAISSCCLHPCCPWTLGHRLTPWLAQASLRLPSSAVHMTVMEGVLDAGTDPQGGFTYLLQLYLNNCHCFRGNHTYLWAWTLHESSRMQCPTLPLFPVIWQQITADGPSVNI